MKTLFIVMMMAVSGSAFAKSTVWCKDSDGKVVDSQDENYGYECDYAIAFEEACFTGKRSEVIDLLNTEGNFGSDEEWIDNAKYKGRDEISYEWVDGPNELREKKTLVRCEPDFFK